MLVFSNLRLSIQSYWRLLPLSILLFRCQTATQPLTQPYTDSSKSYRIDTVRRLAPNRELNLNGTITFNQDDVLRVFPMVSGNVEQISAPIGAQVQKGQLLATIRSGDISAYVNEFEAAKSDLAVVRQQLINISAQYQAGFASETEFLTAQNTVKKAEEALRKATLILNVYGGNSKSPSPFFRVKAPLSGYIVERNVNAGQDLRADVQTPLFTISSLREVWVLANVYEQDIPLVHLGQTVRVHVLAYPNKVFQGTISSISSVLDQQARVLTVRIVLPNPNGLLKPQMFATVHAQLTSSPISAELAIPQKAVIFDHDHYYVVVQKKPHQLKVQEITVKHYSSQYAFVPDKELNPGDIVLTDGSLLAYNDLIN